METTISQTKAADEPTSSSGAALPARLRGRSQCCTWNLGNSGAAKARARVLEVACEMFAETGFHGTHLREICRRAGTNVAGVCYYFHSKEGLYEAVIIEASQRLRDHREGFVSTSHSLPEARLLKLVESLMQRLSTEGGWIAKLLARELVDPVCGARNYLASGLEWDFVLFQAVMRDLLGSRVNGEAIRLHALSLISECVYYSLARENPLHPLTQFAVDLPTRARLAQFLTQRSLGALERESF